MSNSITVTIGVMREAVKGLSYWVTFNREDGQNVTPFMSYQMDHAIIEAAKYAHFFGVEMPKVVPMEDMGLTQEMIDAAYKAAKNMLEFEEFKYGTKP